MSEEVEVKVLKKHMGGVVQMLKDLKNSVKVLEKRLDYKEDKEIKEIIEDQAIIEEILVVNDDANGWIKKNTWLGQDWAQP